MIDINENKIKTVIKEVLGVSGNDDVPNDNWDSLAQIHIILGVEKVFAIRFDETNIPQLRSLQVLVEAVNELCATKHQ